MKGRELHANHHDRQFPKGFLWGTATSAYQVEGFNGNADWWHWEQKGKKIADGTTSGKGVDHYHRFEEDFDLAKDLLHNNAHRLSVEWSRLEPEEGVWNDMEFAHYRNVLKALKARKMKVMLTLHHFTNPQWLAEKGGWHGRVAVPAYLRFVKKVCEELGDHVDFWVTINEPMVYVGQGYIIGEWPPEQKRKYWQSFSVLRNFVRAHRGAYKIIHRWSKTKGKKRAQVGIANNVSSFSTYRKHSLVDQVLVAIMDRLSNHLFYVLSRPSTHDFLGLNYYFHFRIQGFWSYVKGLAGMSRMDAQNVNFESSDVGWELFPHGIFDVCVDLASYKKPIYITENGLATKNDDKRIRLLVGYLLQLYHATKAGADVRGYFHWSLLDNFEWAKGYDPTFGLIEVNRKTGKRTPRPSAEVYGWLAKQNAIEHDMLRFLGHGTRDILEQWKKTHCNEEESCI